MNLQAGLRTDVRKAATIAAVCGGRLVAGAGACQRITTDSRSLQPQEAFLALHGPSFDGHDYIAGAFAAGAAGVIVDRPLSVEAEAARPHSAFVVEVPDTQAALIQLAAAHRGALSWIPVVAVTGSCGKTTVKDMLGWMLARRGETVWSRKSFNNHLGVPLTLLELQPTTKAAVVEIGTSNNGEIAALAAVAAPDFAIVTVVASAHLEGLGSLAGVAREKGALVDAVKPSGGAILNGDDPLVRAMAARCRGKVVFVSARADRDADWSIGDLRLTLQGSTFLLHCKALDAPITVQLPRVGRHNAQNAVFALAAAFELGVPIGDAVAALKSLPPTPRRLELHQVRGCTVVDDTYNMNPGSALAAIATLAELPAHRRVLVLGEMLELGESSVSLHHQIGEAVGKSSFDLLITVGDGAASIASGAVKAGMPVVQIQQAVDVEDTLRRLCTFLQAGDCVLLKASRRVQLERVTDALLAYVTLSEATG